MKNNEQLRAGVSSAGAADSVQLRGYSHYEYHSSQPSDSECMTPTPLYKIYTCTMYANLDNIYFTVKHVINTFLRLSSPNLNSDDLQSNITNRNRFKN